MRSARFFATLLAGAALLPLPFAASAQTMQPSVAPASDADELASQVHRLAANPQDLNALIRAGELTLRLDDPTAAAAFFARAQRIDPRNPRIEAGMGTLLVGEERPGEALRRFGTAQSLGGDPRTFAAARGLAYDLIGEQERAQRDYRLALHDAPNDETERRYALSLGISGKRDEALRELDPLLRKSDRGAWRDRAFILAMSGDRSGAEKIATTMLPPGMAAGLQPFFERLPSLPAADRAFAVHFGETRASPERIADARLTPPLPVLGRDPYPPVAVAEARVVAAPVEDRRHSKKRKGLAIQVATTPPPLPLPAPPVYVGSNTVSTNLGRQTVPTRPSYSTAMVQPLPSQTRYSAATVQPLPTRVAPVVVGKPAVSLPIVRDAPVSASAIPAKPTVPVATPVHDALIMTSTPPPVVIAAPPPALAASPVAVTPVPVVVATQSIAAPISAQIATTDLPPSLASAPATAPVIATQPLTPVTTPAPVRSEDSILASIIAGVKVPETEAIRAAPPVTAPIVATPPPAVESASVAPPPKTGKKLADVKKPADEAKAVDPKKAATDKKATEAKKAADAKKTADAKKLADQRKAEKADPARIWVQVAGGANEDTLPKAWAAVREKAPAAFKGKQGWTTPLRATNRVLAGPFKSDEDARAFVNTLKKEGVSAFTFSSDAGQKITRLPAK